MQPGAGYVISFALIVVEKYNGPLHKNDHAIIKRLKNKLHEAIDHPYAYEYFPTVCTETLDRLPYSSPPYARIGTEKSVRLVQCARNIMLDAGYCAHLRLHLSMVQS